MLDHLRTRLRELSDGRTARSLARSFATAPGETSEGERFLGIRTPALHRLVPEYEGLPVHVLRRLLASAFHEERLLALLILVRRYQCRDQHERRLVYETCLACTDRINTWQLVDVAAEHIVGAHLRAGGDSMERLEELAGSQRVQERRLALVATLPFIKQGEPEPALRLAERLLRDPETSIHKAVGWMLREIERRNPEAARRFLDRHHAHMPRTMLHQAVRDMPEVQRRAYLEPNARQGG